MSEEIREGFTRVTSVLSPYNDFSNINPEVLQRACDRGTKVHRLCETYANGDYVPPPESPLEGYFRSFTGWYDEMVDKVLLLEWRAYNEILMLTGCVDAVVILKGDTEPTVVDYKTSSVVSKSWALQTAMYHDLVNDRGDIKPKRRIALQLKKDGKKPKVIEYTNLSRDLDLYLSAYKLYRWFNG